METLGKDTIFDGIIQWVHNTDLETTEHKLSGVNPLNNSDKTEMKYSAKRKSKEKVENNVGIEKDFLINLHQRMTRLKVLTTADQR